MTDDPLDSLLVKLKDGDEAAAERIFRDYEPFLRAIVRRRLTPALRTKFDSMDVVQSAWADVLEGYRTRGWQFADRDHLRAFLARVAFNHFALHCRLNAGALEREQPISWTDPGSQPLDAEPRPSQLVEADELWERIVRSCPPAHQEILILKRQGFPVDEIAGRAGLHPGSVRRILYEVARRMATDRAGGGAFPPTP